MSKVIVSPVAEFPGTVTLHDPLTFPMAIAFNRGRAKAQVSDDQIDVFYQSLQAVMPCIEQWHITTLNPEQQNPDNFPSSPLGPSSQFVAWLVNEITALLFRPETVPNELGPRPTSTS